MALLREIGEGSTGVALSSSSIGRHSELVTALALLTGGYDVLEPIVETAYDYAITEPGTHEMKRIQIKTITRRVRNGVNYYIIKGKKSSGIPYTADEADYFAGVVDGKVYIVKNLGLSEYWSRVEEAPIKWQQLPTLIN